MVRAIDGRKLAEAKETKMPPSAQTAMIAADRTGDRRTLTADSLIPLTMAVIYLGMVI